MAKVFKTDVIFLEDVIFRGNVECKGDATFRRDLSVYGNLTAFQETMIPVESFGRPNTLWNRLAFLFKGK